MESLKTSARFKRPAVIAIGASTGGPQALLTFFSALGRDVRQPFFVTQHMPAPFTETLAESIAQRTGLDCCEAGDDEPVQAGKIYIAPGGFHMEVEGEASHARVRLSSTDPENFCRPAIDPMLRSLASVYGDAVLALILTGMGRDGLEGCRAIHAAGGRVLVQDKDSSTVWSMPGAVAEEGLAEEIVPLSEMADIVRHYAGAS